MFDLGIAPLQQLKSMFHSENNMIQISIIGAMNVNIWRDPRRASGQDHLCLPKTLENSFMQR